MTTSDQPGFQSRVDAVFGALSGSQPEEAWSLSGQQVYRIGKESEYSSDEEQEAKQGDAERQNLLSSGVDLEDRAINDDGLLEKPSNAFCKALDNEDEYDAIDAVAFGVVERARDHKPPKNTEVLDGNIFERKSLGYQAGAKGITPPNDGRQDQQDGTTEVMEVDLPTTDAGAPDQSTEVIQASTSGAADRAEDSQGAAKRVRFAQGAEPWVPPHRRPNDSESSRRQDGSSNSGRPPKAPAAGRGTVVPQRPPRSRSYVPDHVRNPQKYTAYVLDEPITVGSGDIGDASADDGRSSIAQAARAAQTAAIAAQPLGVSQPDAEVKLPAFGAGIAFNPQVKASKAKEAPLETAAERATLQHVSASLAEEDLSNEQEGEDEAANDMAIGDASFAPRKQRNRSLRTRAPA